jgi:hypothetical protein
VSRPIPIVLCIDVEPDERAPPPSTRPDWTGFERAVADAYRVRRLLADATGRPARFAWFVRMDPQIEHVYGTAEWAALRYAAEIGAIEGAGDTIGLHVHPWRWDGREWVVDFADVGFGTRCVRVAFAAFARAFGRPCRDVRFGDRWLNDRILALAERLGARYDLTAEPGRVFEAMPERSVGTSPDYSAMPRVPYRPSRRGFRRPGRWLRRRTWMLPLGTARLASALDAWSVCAAAPSPAPPSADGAYEGWIDHADREAIAGWACDRRAPDRVLEVEVRDGGRPIAVLPAGLHRLDLAAAGMGAGRHAFRFPVAHVLRDGRPHVLDVYVRGTDVALRGGPVELAAAPGGEPADVVLNFDLARDSAILRGLVDTSLAGGATSHLAFVVRCSAAANPDTRGSVEQSLRWLARHPRVQDLAFVGPADAIAMIRN